MALGPQGVSMLLAGAGLLAASAIATWMWFRDRSPTLQPSPGLAAVLQRAEGEWSLARLLLESPELDDLLRLWEVDREGLHAELASREGEDRSGGRPAIRKRLSELVTHRWHSTGHPVVEIDGLDLMTHLMDFGPSELRAIFEAHGLDAMAVVFWRAHGFREEDAAPFDAGIEGAEACDIELINDDVTTMDFVTDALEDVLGYAPEDARQLMLTVHERGSARLGPVASGEARRCAGTIIEVARSRGFPLRVRLHPREGDASG